MELLLEYNFIIEFQVGKQNVVANALSRKSVIASTKILQMTLLDKFKELICQF